VIDDCSVPEASSSAAIPAAQAGREGSLCELGCVLAEEAPGASAPALDVDGAADNDRVVGLEACDLAGFETVRRRSSSGSSDSERANTCLRRPHADQPAQPHRTRDGRELPTRVPRPSPIIRSPEAPQGASSGAGRRKGPRWLLRREVQCRGPRLRLPGPGGQPSRRYRTVKRRSRCVRPSEGGSLIQPERRAPSRSTLWWQSNPVDTLERVKYCKLLPGPTS